MVEPERATRRDATSGHSLPKNRLKIKERHQKEGKSRTIRPHNKPTEVVALLRCQPPPTKMTQMSKRFRPNRTRVDSYYTDSRGPHTISHQPSKACKRIPHHQWNVIGSIADDETVLPVDQRSNWPKESMGDLVRQSKSRTKMAAISIIHIFILLLFALSSLNLTVIHCEEYLSQLRPAIAQQLSISDSSWLETKRLDALSPAAEHNDSTNRRMDDEEDGESDDDDEDNEANETSGYLERGSAGQLSPRRVRRRADPPSSGDRDSGSTSANRQLPPAALGGAQASSGATGATGASGAPVGAAGAEPRESLSGGGSPVSTDGQSVSASTGRQLLAAAAGRDPQQAPSSADPRSESRGSALEAQAGVAKREQSDAKSKAASWRARPEVQQTRQHSQRNVNATREAQAKLRATMDQLHYNKSLGLDVARSGAPTEQRQLEEPAPMEDETSLMPGESSQVNVYAKLAPLVQLEKQRAPLISVSATRAPLHWIEYRPPSNRRPAANSAAGDLQTAASEDSHQRGHARATISALRNAKLEIMGPDDDQWGRRKSAPVASGGGTEQPAAQVAAAAASDQNPQESNKTHHPSDNTIDWPAPSAPFRASPIYRQPGGDFRANSNLVASNFYTGNSSNHQLATKSGKQIPEYNSILPIVQRDPTAKSPPPAMGAEPLASQVRGWHQVATPATPVSSMRSEVINGPTSPLRAPPAPAQTLKSSTPVSNSIDAEGDDSDDDDQSSDEVSEAQQPIAGGQQVQQQPAATAAAAAGGVQELTSRPLKQADWPTASVEVPAERPEVSPGFPPPQAMNQGKWSPTSHQDLAEPAVVGDGDRPRGQRHQQAGFGTKSQRPAGAHLIPGPLVKPISGAAAAESFRQAEATRATPLPAPVVKQGRLSMTNVDEFTTQQLLHPFAAHHHHQQQVGAFAPPALPARASDIAQVSPRRQQQQQLPIHGNHVWQHQSTSQMGGASGPAPVARHFVLDARPNGRMDESSRQQNPRPAAATEISKPNSSSSRQVEQQRPPPQHHNSSATLSITTFPYPAPATEALSFFSVYSPHKLLPEPHLHSLGRSHQQQRQRQFSAPADNSSSSSMLNDNTMMRDDWQQSGSAMAASTASANLRVGQGDGATKQQQQPIMRDQRELMRESGDPNSFLTINLRTQAAVGPNQLFWEAAAREVAQSSHHHHHHRLGPHLSASPVAILRRPLRFVLSPGDALGGPTNGHSLAGFSAATPMKRRAPAPSLGLRSLAGSDHFAHFVQHLHPPGSPDAASTAHRGFSYLESAPHAFYPMAALRPAPLEHPADLSGFVAAAAAMPVSAFVAPSNLVEPAHTAGPPAKSPGATGTSSSSSSTQFLKKGQALISAALPLATPASVSDPFGWPMGYGSEAAKSLVKVNHVAPPPAYLIPAKVAAAQSSAYLYPTLIDLKQGSSSPVKEDSSTIIGDHLAAAGADPADELADQHWPHHHQLVGQHSVLRPQIWMAPGHLRQLQPMASSPEPAEVPSGQQQKVNHVRVRLSTRAPAVKRLSLWRRLRLFRNNNNQRSSNKQKQSADQPQDDQSPTNDLADEPNDDWQRRVSTGGRREKRSLRQSVSNFVSSLKGAAQAATSGQLAGHRAKDPLTQSATTNQQQQETLQSLQEPAVGGGHRSRTSYIPLVDKADQMIANLESDLLAAALIDQPPPTRVHQSDSSGRPQQQQQNNKSTRKGHQDPMMDTGSMLVASHAALNQQASGASPAASQLYNGEFRPLLEPTGLDGPTASSQLDQLYASLSAEPEATLEPPVNAPGMLSRPPNSSRERLVQLSKNLINSSKKPLNKLMRITSLTSRQNSTSTSTSTKSGGSSSSSSGKQKTGGGGGMGTMASSSQQSISVAHQLGAVVSPSVMMQENSSGSLENFNRFALPLQQWFRMQQQSSHRPPLAQPTSGYAAQQLLPLVSHSSIHLSPYSLVSESSLQQYAASLPPRLSTRLRADNVNSRNTSRGAADARPTHFLARVPDGLLLQAAAKSLLEWGKTLRGEDSMMTSQSIRSPQLVAQSAAGGAPTAQKSHGTALKSLVPLARLARGRLEQVAGRRQKLRPSARSAESAPTILVPRVEQPAASLRRTSDFDTQQRLAARQSGGGGPFGAAQHQQHLESGMGNVTSALWAHHQASQLRLLGGHPQAAKQQPAQPANGQQRFRSVFMGAPTAQHRELVNGGGGNGNGRNSRFSLRFPSGSGGQPNSNAADQQLANQLMAMQQQQQVAQSRNQSSPNHGRFVHTDQEIYSAASNQHQVELGAEMEAAGVKLEGPQQAEAGAPLDESSFNSLMAASQAAVPQDDLQPLLPGGGAGAGPSYQPQQQQQQPPELGPGGKELNGVSGGAADSGEFPNLEQQQQQQQLISQQQQQMMYQPDLGNGITITRPRLPKFIPSINSMANKFRQHLFQTFKLNPARWPMLGSASFISAAKFQAPNFLANSMGQQQQLGQYPVPLPQQQQLRLQTALQHQQQQHLQHQQKLLHPQHPHPHHHQKHFQAHLLARPHSGPASANYYTFGAGTSPAMDSLPNSKATNSIHFHEQQQQQPQPQPQPQQQVGGQFQVPAASQFQQHRLALNRGHQQFKLNLNGRPTPLAASEQAAIQVDGQLAAVDGPQPMTVDEGGQIVYTDKVPPGMGDPSQPQQQPQQVAHQHHHRHHPHQQHLHHHSLQNGGEMPNGQTMVEFVPAASGNGSATGSDELQAAHELYEAQEMLVDPNSLGQQEESVASQLANGQELIIPPANQPSSTASDQQQQQQAAANQPPTGGASGQQHLPPQHSVMTDVSSNLVTSDGTYIQEEPPHHTGAGQPPRHSMGELATASHHSESKDSAPEQQQGANVSTAVLHHHHHVMMPSGSEELESHDRRRPDQQQQPYQLEQQLGSPEAAGQAPSEPGESSAQYELEHQVQAARQRQTHHQKRGNGKRAQVRLVQSAGSGQQQQRNRAGLRSKLQFVGAGEPVDSQNADYQIIKAASQQAADSQLQYMNGTGVDLAAMYQKGGRKLPPRILHSISMQSQPESGEEQQQQQPPLQQQVYEFENQMMVTTGNGEQYYEPQMGGNHTSEADGDQVVGAMIYAESNGTDASSHHPFAVHHHYPLSQRTRAQLAHFRPNQSEAGVEYHFRPLASGGDQGEPNSTRHSGEQSVDETRGAHFRHYSAGNASKSLYPFAVSQTRGSTHTLLRLNDSALLRQEQAVLGSLGSSSQDQYVLVDQPVLVSGSEQTTLSTNQTVTEVVRHHGGGRNSTGAEQPMVFVSIKPERVILPAAPNHQPPAAAASHLDHQLQQLQQVQLQLQLQNQQGKRRPLKGPKGAQAKMQWQQQQQPLLSRIPQQHPQLHTVQAQRDNSSALVEANSTASSPGSESNESQQRATLIKNIENHNLKPQAAAPTSPAPAIVLMRESFTRPPKAKIRWQGMAGRNQANGTTRSELNQSETNRADQAWVVNGVTHQNYASNHKPAEQQQVAEQSGSVQTSSKAAESHIASGGGGGGGGGGVVGNSSSTIARLYQNHKHSSYPDLSGKNASSQQLEEAAQVSTTPQPDAQTTQAGFTTTTTTSSIGFVESTTPAPADASGQETTTTRPSDSSRVYSHFGIHSAASGRSRQQQQEPAGGNQPDESQRGRFQTFRSGAANRFSNHKQSVMPPTTTPAPAPPTASPATQPVGGSQRRDSRTGSTSFRLSSSSSTTVQTSTSQAPQLPLPVAEGASPTPPMSPPIEVAPNITTTGQQTAEIPTTPAQPSERPTVFVSGVELSSSQREESFNQATERPAINSRSDSEVTLAGNEYPSSGNNYTQPDRPSRGSRQRPTSESSVEEVTSIFTSDLNATRDSLTEASEGLRGDSLGGEFSKDDFNNQRGLVEELSGGALEHSRAKSPTAFLISGGSGLLMSDSSQYD